MIADALRKSILQQAIQGKLSEQLPSDGDARALLREIQAEKLRLIAEKKIKAAPPLPPISADEIPFEIPQNWCWVRLGDICINFQYGTAKKSLASGLVPVLRMGNLQNGYIDYNNLVFTSDKNDIKLYSLQINDLLFNRTNSSELVGKTAVYKGEQQAIFAGYLVRITPILASSEYINSTMQTPYYKKFCYSVQSQGVNQCNINAEKVRKFLIPLPPIAEQKRIVAKLEKLMPLLERLDAAEKKLAALNKTFPDQLRKSILQQAIQGKLSEQLPSDGDARALLREIQAEKLRLIAEKKIKATPPLPPITADEIPFEIPANWCWARLGDICILTKGKKISAGKLPYLDAKYLRGLKEKNLIDSGIFVQAGEKLILVDGENSSEIFTAPENGYMGSTFQTLDISQNISVDYFQYFVLTKKDYYKKNKRGSAIPHLDKNLFFSTLVPLPPLAEQKRIVAKLEKVLPLCDRLAEKLK